MAPFYTLFHELAHHETRFWVVTHHESLPDGEYGLVEFFCNEPECDCRRVILQVETAEPDHRVWASINYGWERPSYYARWAGVPVSAARQHARATLDTLNPQSPHAFTFLWMFREMIVQDRPYALRLRRHYRLFKRALMDL